MVGGFSGSGGGECGACVRLVWGGRAPLLWTGHNFVPPTHPLLAAYSCPPCPALPCLPYHLQGHVGAMARDEWGHLALITALGVVDDTTLLHKAVVAELQVGGFGSGWGW